MGPKYVVARGMGEEVVVVVKMHQMEGIAYNGCGGGEALVREYLMRV